MGRTISFCPCAFSISVSSFHLKSLKLEFALVISFLQKIIYFVRRLASRYFSAFFHFCRMLCFILAPRHMRRKHLKIHAKAMQARSREKLAPRRSSAPSKEIYQTSETMARWRIFATSISPVIVVYLSLQKQDAPLVLLSSRYAVSFIRVPARRCGDRSSRPGGRAESRLRGFGL